MLLFYWYAICYIHLIGKFKGGSINYTRKVF